MLHQLELNLTSKIKGEKNNYMILLLSFDRYTA